jgi:hypothetical protein
MIMPFTSLTRVRAKVFAQRISAQTLVPSFKIFGRWHCRRFIVDRIEAGKEVVFEPVPDYSTLALTVPVSDDPEYYINELKRFGATVESRARKERAFQFVTGGDDQRHMIHSYHHIALCGHRGPWPESANPVADSVTCIACAIKAISIPPYRARYHPGKS